MRRLIAQGIHASVYEASFNDLALRLDSKTLSDLTANSSGSPGLLATKVIHDGVANMPPHDVLREVKLLKRIEHENIITLLHYDHDLYQGQHNLFLPRYAITLARLLDNPYFSPIPPNTSTPYLSKTSYSLSPFDPLQHLLSTNLSRITAFNLLSDRTAHQLLSALHYLHTLEPPIAHRDIKPSNIMLDWDGNIRVIDFGIAVEGSISNGNEAGGMRSRTLQVGAGAYRAPELLFGADSYSPLAIDIWAAGVTIASLFTPLQHGPSSSSTVVNIDLLEEDHSGQSVIPALTIASEDTGFSEDESDDDPGSIGIATLGGKTSALAKLAKMGWRRQCLFEGGMGDLGLVWSIFRVKGTPTNESWPSFGQLPDSRKLAFSPTKGVTLSRALPMLCPSNASKGEAGIGDSILETIEGMLDYDADRRWSAEKCLSSKWLAGMDRETPEARVIRKQLMEGFFRG